MIETRQSSHYEAVVKEGKMASLGDIKAVNPHLETAIVGHKDNGDLIGQHVFDIDSAGNVIFDTLVWMKGRPNPPLYPDPRPLEKVSDFQRVIGRWKMELNPPEGGLKAEFKGLKDESRELGKAIHEGDPKHIAEEAIDVIIRGLQIVHETGYDAGSELREKLSIMMTKYSTSEHQRLRREGHTFESAMAHQKTIFEAKKDS